jgi:DNA replication protein DnaC
MLTEPTLEKLKSLHLDAMAAAWLEQQRSADAASLGFEERFAMLVDAESLYRENRRLAKLLKDAKLRIGNACVEDIHYTARRELDKALVRQLASCRWIAEHQNIVITGMTGTGKSYLACALGQQACRKGYRTLYRRASRLTDELTLARADGTHVRLLSKLARVDVLIIDDWGHAALRDQERHDLLEILDDRYDLRSTIMTSQLPIKEWHDHIGDPTHADAICDRLLHNAHRIVLKGPSKRKPETKEDRTEK